MPGDVAEPQTTWGVLFPWLVALSVLGLCTLWLRSSENSREASQKAAPRPPPVAAAAAFAAPAKKLDTESRWSALIDQAIAEAVRATAAPSESSGTCTEADADRVDAFLRQHPDYDRANPMETWFPLSDVKRKFPSVPVNSLMASTRFETMFSSGGTFIRLKRPTH